MAPPQRPILAMVLVCTFSLVVFFAAQEDATGSVLESNYHSQMVYSQVSNAIDQGENVNVKGAISSVAPQRGPSSGGTLLTIMGRDFTTGGKPSDTVYGAHTDYRLSMVTVIASQIGRIVVTETHTHSTKTARQRACECSLRECSLRQCLSNIAARLEVSNPNPLPQATRAT